MNIPHSSPDSMAAPKAASHSTSTAKALKGSVNLKISNNRIQLVFTVAGKRYYLSTGLADTSANRKLT